MQPPEEFIKTFAAANGVEAERVEAIGGYANQMFKLEPHPIVARVAGSASKVREGDTWLAREVKLADYLSRTPVKVVRPLSVFPPGPHKFGTHYVTFWEHLEIAPRVVTPIELGSALREIHLHLRDYPAELPVMGALEETWAILTRNDVSDRLAAADREIVARMADRVRTALSAREIPLRPLHGDAHHGNLWPTCQGLVWGDFEDAHLGPVEWDLACMTASSSVLGNGRAAAAALHAYAQNYDAELLELLVVARTLQGIAWSAISLAELNADPRFRKRLNWLAR